MKFKIYSILAIFLFFSVSTLHAQVDIFMEAGSTIKGESQNIRYKDQIEIASFAQEESLEVATFGTGGGAGAGKPTMGNFVFSMPINQSIIGFKKTLYKGTHLPKITVSFVKRLGAGDQFVYYKITLEEVNVVNITDAVCGTCGDKNANQIQLKAAKVTWEYTRQDQTGKPILPALKFGWDVAANREL